ncbi:hypothetical protein [Bythopirellula goksoeyrii]|uniref:Uncharacterized protein n=1 Tax=Bythopirellula goksoeyrii TaxID=1400387 RepID=A0A5B9QF24_9BACT|nr:hypothetical protein [Bythopirellula goksoeyrii]QEG36122.1 hypothetical protein Pr1d_34310 [Bythopirellula goksoeyrii]
MITVSKPLECNRHIQDLKKVSQQADRQLSWVVFADDDPVMLRQLREALKKESAAIIPTPQYLWSGGEDTLKDAVLWSIEELPMTSLVLVGNSAAAVSVSEPMLSGQITAGEGENEILASVRVAERKRCLAAEHFSQQVQAMINVPEISGSLMTGSLALHCLFYRAESGVFAFYDPRDGSFRSLIG